MVFKRLQHNYKEIFKMRKWIKMLPLLAAILSISAVAHAVDKPSVIRFVVPGYVPEKASPTQLLFTVVWEQGLLQQEFSKDGIRIERILTKQAGPGVNEAFANGKADFGQCGDFPLTVGRSGGLKTKLILGQENGSTTYIIARAGSGIRTVQDLKGKRVGYQKGTNSQPAIIKILALNGMTLNDIKSVNVTVADGSAALVAGTVDALLSGYDRPLVHQGVAVDIYNDKARDYDSRGKNGLVVSEEFAARYPDITKRLVKVFLRAGYYASQEKNRAALNATRAKLGANYTFAVQDWVGQDLKVKFNPLLKKSTVESYKNLQQFALKNGLVRQGFNVDTWVDTRFQEAALAELGLQNYWDR